MDRCNFRCTYCMPRETFDDRYRFLSTGERLTFDEISRLARLFVSMGVRKLRLTGGEPLLRSGLADLVGELSSIDGVEDLALTTNGVLLAQHAAELAANGLRRVTVSLDTLDPGTFRRMSGGFDGLERVLDGIHAALEAGLVPVKVNTVVQRGINDGQVLEIAHRFRGTGVILRFIEYMDVGNRNDWDPDRVVPSRRAEGLDCCRLSVAARGRQLPRRSCRALCLRGRLGRTRVHFVREPAVLRRLHASATVLGRRVLHLPLRNERHGPACTAARRRWR